MVDAVILAAGYSSRADGFKMNFMMHGKTVLQHVIEAFYPICDHIYVVGGYQYEKLIPLMEPYQAKVELVWNEDYAKGMFSSVKAGIKKVKSEHFFITPGDYPLITTKICEEILASNQTFVIPSFQKRGGHPILLPQFCIEEILAESDDSNLKKYLSTKPRVYLEVEEDSILYDLDTREDYMRLIEKAGGELAIADIGIINGRVYTDNQFMEMNLYIKGEKIECITKERLPCRKEIDVKGCRILPGFIDPHVHFHLGVGKCVSSDDFYSGSLQAALGGITTYIDFLDPVKEAVEIDTKFQERCELAQKSITDYAFHTTIANPKDSAEAIIKTSKKNGITSIKLFTTYSDTDRRTKDEYIYELLKCSKEEEIKIVVHAENDDKISKSKTILVKDHEKSRPVLSETVEVLQLARMQRETEGNLYIVHVSAGSTVEEVVREFKKEIAEKKIILESCPHYFIFNSEIYETQKGYQYTMTPPLRPEGERIRLSKNFDHIETIGTDHCPFQEKYKDKKYTSEISMGIGGLKYSFLNMYTLFQDRVIDKFTKNPAQAYGLYPQKGALLPGSDADIVIFDEKAETVVTDRDSVYRGRTLQGAIKQVFLRGKSIVLEGEIEAEEMTGKYIGR